MAHSDCALQHDIAEKMECHLPRFLLSKINLLHVQGVCVWMSVHFHNLAHPDVELIYPRLSTLGGWRCLASNPFLLCFLALQSNRKSPKARMSDRNAQTARWYACSVELRKYSHQTFFDASATFAASLGAAEGFAEG